MPTKIFSLNTSGADAGGIVDIHLVDSGTNGHNDDLCEIAGNGTAPTRSLIFQLSQSTLTANIPSGSTINSVTISLYRLVGSYADPPITMNFARMLRNWVLGEVSQFNWSTGNAWSANYGVGSGTDRASSVSLSQSGVTYTPIDVYVDFTGSGLATDLQNFLDGAVNNYGWVVWTTNDGVIKFATSEGTDGTRPVMTVDYTEPSGPPPSSLIVRSQRIVGAW